MRDLKKELFKILLLDKGNHISEVIDIDVGTVDRVNPCAHHYPTRQE